ncbi:MAG: UDP-N-acetylmuramoyl-L-alanine--D-glutamate ligase [Patescibacteria group bacterium]
MKNIKQKKRVLILGLGQFAKGSGISAALYFARLGHSIRVTDQKSEHDLAANVKRLKRFKNVVFVLGRHRLSDIRWADIIVRNPRVRPDSPEMVLASRLGKQVESDISLFLKNCPCPVVGVTGTRGKSTTTGLIGDMLEKSGFRTWIGGNILVSPLTFASKVRAGDKVVLELSSWQLESTGLLGQSPHIAVITNLMRDHLNSYENMEAYAEAKAQIFRHQKPNDFLVLNSNDLFCKKFAPEAPSEVLFFGADKKNDAVLTKDFLVWKDRGSAKKLIRLERKRLKLMGDHNALNVLAAGLTARLAGANWPAIKRSAISFKGLENRLETIRAWHGITFINDTTATTPDATIAAIKALKPKFKKIHLLMGGADKVLEFDGLTKELKAANVSISVFEGTAYEKIAKALKKRGIPFYKANSLRAAFAQHLKNAVAGDAVILSPGCASFGMFKNEFDRGEQFKKIVKKQ